MKPTECLGRGFCSGGDRWECGQLAGWLDSAGMQPWGNESDEGVYPYLATMTLEEQAELSEIAAMDLDEGSWQGYESPNGGWLESGPIDDIEEGWRATALDFIMRFEAGERSLTEGMLAYAAHDLARELAWIRGWCYLLGGEESTGEKPIGGLS